MIFGVSAILSPMKSNRVGIHYQTGIIIPRDRIQSIRLCYEPSLSQYSGIDTKNLVRGYPEHCLKLPEEWLALSEQGRPCGGGAVLVQTVRNCIQNLGCVVWSRGAGLCHSRNEYPEKRTRPYRGVGLLRTGGVCALEFVPSVAPPEEVDFFAAGIPVLWGGRVLTLEEIAPEVADFAHLWRFPERGGSDNSRFGRFQEAYEEARHRAGPKVAEIMIDLSRGSSSGGPALSREAAYLHNAVGVTQDGGMFMIVANGTLERIGELAKEAGAIAAIVVDNGGSCQISLRRGPGKALRPIVESFYHRTPSIAVVIVEMKETDGHPISGLSGLGESGSAEIHQSMPSKLGVVEFETPAGLVRKDIPLQASSLAAADRTAIVIGNFAMTHGASAVHIDAPIEFTPHVQSFFRQRFRAISRTEDALGTHGMWLEDYLESLSGRPFSIHHGRACGPVSKAHKGSLRRRETPLRHVLGLDIGAGNIKAAVLIEGIPASVERRPTRISGQPYTSVSLGRHISDAAAAACQKAGIALSDVNAVGISWAGALRDGAAAASKILLNMEDVLRGGTLDVAKFQEVRQIALWVGSQLRLGDQTEVRAWNDGEVELVWHALQSGRRRMLLVKLGTSVAGAFIDAEGCSDYLTELGRIILRPDSEAPRHPFSQIQGVASQLIGSAALARLVNAAGIRTESGEPITAEDAGRELGGMLGIQDARRPVVTQILDEMGWYLAGLITEACSHLPEVSHVLLRGGLLSGEVGARLRSSLRTHLPGRFSSMIREDDTHQESGAIASGSLVALFQQD